MSAPSRSNLILGLVTAAFALVALFVWIPFDTDTGFIEKVRRQVTVGDAAAPSVAALFLLIGGALLVFVERAAPDQPRLSSKRLRFIFGFVLWVTLSLLVMRYAGPLAAYLFGAESDYRLLRDTVPWKYIGFTLGGTMLIGGGVAMVEARLSFRTLFLALAITVAIMMVYDLPFDDLLLPPNGDV